jgi:uncharacterized coiled-coil protein SlyX
LTKGVDEINRKMDDVEKLAERAGKAIGAMFTIQKVIAFSKEILADADAFVRLSDKIGITVESVQRLKAVAEDSGNTIDQLSTAVSQMQKRLAGGESGAVSALDQLHVSLGVLKTLQADQQFYTIARAIAAVEDPMERTRLATELFGKTGAEVLPSLRADIDSIVSHTTVMRDDVAKRLDQAGDAWNALWRNIKANAANTFDYLFMGFARADAQMKAALKLPTLPNSPFFQKTQTVDAFALQDAMDRTAPLDKQIRASEAAIKAAKDHEKALRDQDKALEATIRRMDDFAEVNVRAAQSVVTGPLTVLRDLGIAMGDIQIAAKPVVGFMALIPDLSEQAAKRMKSAFGDEGLFGSLLGKAKGMLNPATILNSALGNLLSGGISSLLGFATKGIGSLFGKLFDNPEKQINPVRQAFIDAAGGLDVLNQRAHDAGLTLDRILDAKNPQQYEAAIKQLNDAFAFQDTAMKTLDDTVAKYGITIDQLGPKFRQQKLDELAGSLVQDYQVLTAAGIDNVTVLDKMAPAVNDYIHTILTAGGTIPTQLQPVIEKLTSMGLLTDLAGDKFEDVSKLTFAETLDAKFKTLLDSISKLVDAISNRLGPAIANSIPQNPFGGWQVPDLPLGRDVFDGTIPMASGGAGYASGPMVFSTRGNEEFAFSGEGRRFARSGDTASSGDMGSYMRRLENMFEMLPVQIAAAVAKA